MFLREIGTLWQQQEGYYTRDKQSKANIIARVLLYVKNRIKNNKPEGSEEQKCAVLDLYLTEWEVVQRELQQWLCWHKHNSKDYSAWSGWSEEWLSVTRSFTAVHLVIYSILAGLLQNKEKLVKTVYQARLSVLWKFTKRCESLSDSLGTEQKAHPSQHYCVSAVRVHVYFSGSSTACASARNSLHLARNNFCYLSVTFPSRVILQEDAVPTVWVDVDKSICQLLYI